MFEKRSNSPARLKIPLELSKFKPKTPSLAKKKLSLKRKEDINQNLTIQTPLNPYPQQENPRNTKRHAIIGRPKILSLSKINDLKLTLKSRLEIPPRHRPAQSDIPDPNRTTTDQSRYQIPSRDLEKTSSFKSSPSIDKSMRYLRQKLLKQNNDD
jgi:hypothetical protein